MGSGSGFENRIAMIAIAGNFDTFAFAIGRLDNPFKVMLIDRSAADDLNVVGISSATNAAGDVDFAVIPGNYAASSGIKFTEGLYKEQGYNFINWSAIKRSDLDKKWVKDIKATYESEAFKEYAKKRLEGYKYPQSW